MAAWEALNNAPFSFTILSDQLHLSTEERFPSFFLGFLCLFERLNYDDFDPCLTSIVLNYLARYSNYSFLRRSFLSEL